MSAKPCISDNTRMDNYIYQMIHGHIVVNLRGRPCVLDTGCPVSLGQYPISVCGVEYEVHETYLDISCESLSREIGLPIEGVIGADIIRAYSVGVYPTEQLVQFDENPAEGAIVIPIDNFMGVPILRFGFNDQVLPAFFDTGSPLSYLLPRYLDGLEPEYTQEEYYPLIGNFLTTVYRLPVVIGGETRNLRFGSMPEELRGVADAGGVSAMLGTELLKHFGMCLSIRDRVLKLDAPFSKAVA